MTIQVLTLQKLATKSNDLKKKSSLVEKYEQFDNAKVTSSIRRRKQRLSSFMRKIKKKVYKKEKQQRKMMKKKVSIEKITQDSYYTRLENLVCFTHC